MNSLITAYEAVKYSPFRDNYPTANVCNHIKRVEYKLFNKCYLGLDLLDKMRKDLIPLDEAKNYDSSLIYSEGDLVCYDNCVFISVKDNNTTNPDDASGEPCWEIPRKFKSDCYQDLWECHLRYWLALEIMYTSIRYGTYQAGSKGLVKIVDDSTGVATVNSKEFSEFKKELKHDADDELENMFDWMVRKHKSKECDFGMVPKVVSMCSDGKCVPPGKRRRRRFYFKR